MRTQDAGSAEYGGTKDKDEEWMGGEWGCVRPLIRDTLATCAPRSH